MHCEELVVLGAFLLRMTAQMCVDAKEVLLNDFPDNGDHIFLPDLTEKSTLIDSKLNLSGYSNHLSECQYLHNANRRQGRDYGSRHAILDLLTRSGDLHAERQA